MTELEVDRKKMEETLREEHEGTLNQIKMTLREEVDEDEENLR